MRRHITLCICVALCTAAHIMDSPEANPPRGAVLAMTFNEGPGAKDWSLGGNDGTVNGATYADGAYSFGGNDRITLNSGTDFSPASNLTVSAWVYLDAHSAVYKMIVSKGASSGNYEWWIEVYADNDGTFPSKLAWCVTDPTFANWKCIADPAVFPTGEWVHVVGVWVSGTTMSLYKNGILLSHLTQGAGIPVIVNNAANVSIGSWDTPANYWDGLIDDVKIFRRVLTSVEVKDLYQKGKAQ